MPTPDRAIPTAWIRPLQDLREIVPQYFISWPRCQSGQNEMKFVVFLMIQHRVFSFLAEPPMFDQRGFIERVERANTAEFAGLLASPTYEEEQALRAHFGDHCYQRLHAAARLVAVPEGQRGLSDWLGRPSRPTPASWETWSCCPGSWGANCRRSRRREGREVGSG